LIATGSETQSTVRELAALVGEAGLVTDPAACAAFAVDGKTPNAVVYPNRREQVAAVLKHASDHELAVIPCCNGTKVETGNRPRRYDVALSLREMSQVRHYEPADLTLSVEPGITFGDLQTSLAQHSLWLPLDPAGGARASIGGTLAANSAGPLRVYYGAPRDMVLGMTVATSEGKLIKTGGRVVKNVTGYDLGKLLIGSYGTLGVIVEASFKLFPLPKSRATFSLPVTSLSKARELRQAIQRSPLEPMRLTLLDSEAARLARSGTTFASPWEIWVEAGGSERVIERYRNTLAALARQFGTEAYATSHEAAESSRPRIADFGAALPSGAGTVILRASLPLSTTEQFVGQAQAQTGRSAISVQLGTGITQVCLLDATAGTELKPLIERLRATAIALGGVLIVETCPSTLKTDFDVWGGTGDDFAVMRKIKEVWDPRGTLSPGRLVGGL
jgi:glycolate oxidase FAD binding subunit